MAEDRPSVYVAGHRGMVGSAIVRELEEKGDCEILVRTREPLDLFNQQAVIDFFNSQPIESVYMAAAKVGGIHANDTYPAEFIHQNLVIQSNILP